MAETLYFDSAPYIPVKTAAEMSDFSRDYLSTLARTGKLAARRMGRSWYISKNALDNFLVEQRNRHTERQKIRAASLRAQYADVVQRAPLTVGADHVRERVQATLAQHAAAAASWQAIPTPVGFAQELARTSVHHVPIHAVSPLMEFMHRLIALAFAFVITFGGYALLNPRVGSYAVGEFRDTAKNLKIAAGGVTQGSVAHAFSEAGDETLRIARSAQALTAAAAAVLTDRSASTTAHR